MINKKDVGIRIGKLRKNLGYSQAEFAEILDVSSQAVSKWETGLSLPDMEVLLNISWICKTSMNAILEGDDFIEDIPGIPRSLLRLNKLLICPKCKNGLTLGNSGDGGLVYQCCENHSYQIIDGVIDFKSREIPGEQWSLSFRNYEEYLHEHQWPGNPNYKRGLNQADVIWTELSKIRPRVILDMACGTGQGIKWQIKKINWPVTIIMADLSHRILKWNKVFYETEWKNPYVEMAYLACDGANLPILDNSIDVVFSFAGYESMQAKMTDGFREAYRVLKSGGQTIYTKSTIESHSNENSKRWMDLLFASLENDYEKKYWADEFVDDSQWISICEKIGFVDNHATKIYGELPAPASDRFPFENEMAQWMEESVFLSKKP